MICRKKCVRHQNLCSGARVEAGEIPGGRRKGPDQKQGEKDVACSETMRLFAYNQVSYCHAPWVMGKCHAQVGWRSLRAILAMGMRYIGQGEATMTAAGMRPDLQHIRNVPFPVPTSRASSVTIPMGYRVDALMM